MILYPLLQLTKRGIEVYDFHRDNTSISYSMRELFEEDIGTNKIVVNFNLARASIIEYLLKNTTYHRQIDNKDIVYSYEIKKDYIKIHISKREKINILSYDIKFAQPFRNFNEAKMLEIMDDQGQETLTRDAKYNVYNQLGRNVFIGRRIFDRIFPQPSRDEFRAWKSAKRWVKSFYYVREPKEYKNIYSYDFKGSYASRIYKNKYPVGHCRIEERLPFKRWYIAKIRIYSIAIKKYDYIGINEYFEMNDKEPLSIWATQEVLQIINEFYKCKYKVVKIYSYEFERSFIDNFIFNNVYSNSGNKILKKTQKAKNNLFIGSMGANDIISNCNYSIDDTGERIIIEKEMIEVEKKAYYPFWLYVNGAALLDFISILDMRFDNIIYANTDGFFSKTPYDLDYINSRHCLTLGQLEFRGLYEKMAIKEISNYYGVMNGEGDMRLSGRIKAENVTYQKFINGYQSFTYVQNEYGFLNQFIINEPSMKKYKELWKTYNKLKRLEKMKAFTLVNRTTKEILSRADKTEKRKKIIDELLEMFDTHTDEELQKIERSANKWLSKYNLELVTGAERAKLEEVFI